MYEFKELFYGPWGKAFADANTDQLFGTGTLLMTSTTWETSTYFSSQGTMTCEALKWRAIDNAQWIRKEGGMEPKEPEILARTMGEPDEWAFIITEPDNQKTTDAYVDSGCTCSIFKGWERFIEYQPSSRIVGSAVGTVNMKAEGEGTVEFSTLATNGSLVNISVPALHCPEARHDLISLDGLLNAGAWRVVFGSQTDKTAGILLDAYGNQVNLIKDLGRGLWKITYGPLVEFAGVSTLSVAEQWHLSLSHLNATMICRGSRNTKGMPALRISDFKGKCHDCMLAKAKETGKGSFGAHNIDLITQPLAMISADLCGPMRTMALGGF